MSANARLQLICLHGMIIVSCVALLAGEESALAIAIIAVAQGCAAIATAITDKRKAERGRRAP